MLLFQRYISFARVSHQTESRAISSLAKKKKLPQQLVRCEMAKVLCCSGAAILNAQQLLRY